MGNAVGTIGLTEEQLLQLLRDTQLDRTTATALAEIYASAAPGQAVASPAQSGRKASTVAGASSAAAATHRKASTPLAFMTTLRGSPKVSTRNRHGDAGDGAAGASQAPAAVELTKEQFVKLLEDGGIAQGEAAQKMFTLFDEDGNGRVSMKEFLAHMSLLLKGNPEAKLRFLFRAYDIDDSGHLDMEEVESMGAQMLSSYRSKVVSTQGVEAEVVVRQFLHALDTDGDGSITLDEFLREGLKNPKLLPLLVAPSGWELGEKLLEQRAQKLIQSAGQGRLDKVERLLADVPVDALGDDGTTALVQAARKHPKVVAYLLSKGANINATNLAGETALHRAASARAGAECLTVLLNHGGADVEARNLDFWTPVHVAASVGNVDALRTLSSLGGANLRAVTRNGMTALHVAAANNHAKVVALLAGEGLSINERSKDASGWTPMHTAAASCNIAAVQALVDAGAHINVRDATEATPLMVMAARTSHPEMDAALRLLLAQHANAGLCDGVGNTALHYAAMSNNVVFIQTLGAHQELLLMKNRAGMTPMQVAQRDAESLLQKQFLGNLPELTRKLLDAMRANDLKSVRDLISQGADVNADDGAGNSVLYFAILNKNTEAALSLLGKGAQPNLDAGRGLPLHAAVVTGVVPLVQALVSSGANCQTPDSHFGMHAIHTAAVLNKADVIRVLVARKMVAPDDRTAAGMTPLHFAAQRGSKEATDCLLEHGADKEALSGDGMTPLLLAAANGRSSVLEKLLLAGCNVRALAPGGRTALHLAMGDGDAATIRLLLIAWPDALFMITDGGDTVMHRLCECGSVEPLALLTRDLETLCRTQNLFGQLPLHIACRHASAAFVLQLLVACPSLDVNITDKDNHTAIYYAAAARKDDTVKLLKERGAVFREELQCDKALIRFEPGPGLPRIDCATLDSLIDYLVLTCDMIDDVHFRDVFFLTYRQHLTPAQLLQHLIAMYDSVAGHADGHIPNMRVSSKPSVSVLTASDADLAMGAGDVARPQAQQRWLLLKENALHPALVLRAIRHWVQHSLMDFSTAVALRRAATAQKMAVLSRDQSVSTLAVAMLRGTSPDENCANLNAFLAGVDASSDDIKAELKLIEDAFKVQQKDKATATEGKRARPTGAPANAATATLSLSRRSMMPQSLLDFSPQVVAAQLTLLSKHLWDRLSLWEFYGLAFSKPDKERMCPIISQTIRHVNRVGDWCKTAILESDDAKRRGATITLFVRTLAELIALRNYSDAMSLVTALQAVSVERLTKSWKHVSDDTLELHQRHKAFFDPRGNYSQLRKVIDATPAHEPIIPFLGIVMGDLIHVDEIPTKVNDALINMHKLEMLAKQLALVPRYQKLHYTMEAAPAFIDIFESTELLDETQVRERSRELEPPK